MPGGRPLPVQTLLLATRAVTPATPRTRIILADLADHAFEFRAGQAVFAGLADGTLTRPYSIACSPAQAARSRALELLVQIDDHRAPDPHLERVGRGTRLTIAGPFGSFGVPDDLGTRDLLLVGGGTGISPLRAIMWDTLERRPGVRITIIYSARTEADFAYREELAALAGDARITLFLTLTRDDPAWAGRRGRIDPRLLDAAIRQRDTQCLLCGPISFVEDGRRLLQAAGIDDTLIVTDAYEG